MPRRRPCLTPLPALIAPHHLSTAPLRPHQLGSPRPHRDHRVPSPASHLPHCVPPSASPYVATEQIPRSSPPPSRPSCAAAVLHVLRFAVRIAPTVRRHPRHPLALRRPRGPGWQEPHRMHPFSPNARKRPPSWQHPPEMHAFRDQDGNILAPCIHSRAQSGDSGCMARESCRQGPFFASRNPKSRMARRCCQRRPAFPRQRHATRGMAERALRPAARAWPACRMRPSLPSRLCPPRPAPPAISPAFIAAVLHAPCFAVRDPPRGPRTDVSRHLRAAPIPPAARTHCVQETSGTTQTTQCGHKNRIPKWGPY